jgi:hypothetical protein
LPRPHDHPGTDVSILVRAKGGNLRALDYALEWTVLGIANSGATGLSRFAQWVGNHGNWPRINATRRTRGLKALTETQLGAAANSLAQLAAQTAGRDDRLTIGMVQSLWNAYHIPYLC